ncbi:hypothetical protein PV325_013449, partial [Microctonus aethiopoides]
ITIRESISFMDNSLEKALELMATTLDDNCGKHLPNNKKLKILRVAKFTAKFPNDTGSKFKCPKLDTYHKYDGFAFKLDYESNKHVLVVINLLRDAHRWYLILPLKVNHGTKLLQTCRTELVFLES